MDVLQGNIHIARHLRAIGYGLDELVGPMRGVGVKQPDPEIAGERVQFPQQGANCMATRPGATSLLP